MVLGIPRLTADQSKTVKKAVGKWEKRAVMGTESEDERMELGQREGWEGSRGPAGTRLSATVGAAARSQVSRQ